MARETCTLDLQIGFRKKFKEQPYTLQHLCRRVIIISTIKTVGLYNVHRACTTLPLPRILIQFLTSSSQRAEYFDIKTWGTLVELGYSGKCLLYGELVILKCINLRHRYTHLRDEALLLKNTWMGVRHENISRPIVCFEENDTVGAIFEPLPPILHDKITGQRSLESPRIEEHFVWKVISQLSSALLYLRSRNIDHFKLDSKTISITENWDVKVHNKMLYFACMDNSPVGVPDVHGIFYGIYPPPERISGQDNKDKQDPWRVGCVGYEMMHLEAAFHYRQGVSVYETLNRIVEGVPPPRLSDSNGYSDELAALIHVCLTHNAALRPTIESIYATAREQLEKWRKFQANCVSGTKV